MDGSSVRNAALGVLVLAVLTAAAVTADRPWVTPPPDVSLTGLLRLVPDTAANRAFVVVNDYAAARSAANLRRPADPTEAAAYLDALTTATTPGLATVPSVLSGGRSAGDAWETALGFRFGDVDGDVTVGAGPDQVQAAVGVIDSGFVDAATTSGAAARAGSHRGAARYRWSDGDPVGGSAGELAVASLRAGAGRVCWASDAGRVDAMLDTAAGADPSLAGAPRLAALSSALTASGAHAMFATESPEPFARALVVPSSAPDTTTARAAAEPTVERYDAMATGIALRDGAPLVVVALAYSDAASAQRNASRFADVIRAGWSFGGQRPWSELFTLDGTHVEGSLVVATLHTRLPRLWYDVVVDHDSLLWWS